MDDKMIHLDDCPRKLVSGWIARGNKENDVLFKFVSYWIALNQLYNFDGDDNKKERSRIKSFSRKYAQKIVEALEFNADYMKIFKERPILAGFNTTGEYDWKEEPDSIAQKIINRFKSHKGRLYFESNCKDAANYYVWMNNPNRESEDKAEALLMSIYQVRCNLFHGNKDPELKRNYDLIESSARILEILLPVLRDAVVR